MSAVWASQAQIVELFGVDQSGVSRHIRSVFKNAEVDQESNVQIVHISSSDRPVTFKKELMVSLLDRMISGKAS